MLGGLRSKALQWRQNHQQMLGKVDDLKQKLLQTESDHRIVKSNVGMPITLGLITFFVPIVGGIFMDSLSERSVLSDDSYSSNRTYLGSEVDRVDVPPQAPMKIASPTPLVFVENYTEQELREMSAEARSRACEILYKQARALVGLKDYRRAEEKLDLAMRFSIDDKNMSFIKAEILHKTERYSESIKFLEKPMIIDSNNEGVRLLLGKNYLQLKRYDEAKEQFDFILERNSISFEAKYGLGLVYKALKNNTLAKKTFAGALFIDPNNVDARYEYALMLSRLGDRNKAKEQYDLLYNLDKTKAEESEKDY